MTIAVCYQINLQTGWGGGEVYTVFFSRALASLGIHTVLFVAASAVDRWRARLPAGTEVVGVGDRNLAEVLRTTCPPAAGPAWLVFHTPVAKPTLVPLRAPGRLLTCIAHMPLYGRDPAPLRGYDLVIPVSAHVLASLRAAGITRAHDEPLYGVANLPARHGDGNLRRSSRYDWDRRKLRDRLLGAFEPLVERFRPHPRFTRRDGITLGIVSRLTPIKQFPLLFQHLAPVLARHPHVNLEIFGSGGYASVRDLDRALAPIRSRARFWGHQEDVAAVYRQIDALLAGLPEKEALGLNIIEAQACGTPVMAPDAPPFDETVADGITGLRYRDPREDGGRDFEAKLARLTSGAFRFDREAAREHLELFSEQAFAARVQRLLDRLAAAS